MTDWQRARTSWLLWQPGWYLSKRLPWDAASGPDDPQVTTAIVRGTEKVEFRHWVEACVETIDPADVCPGYYVEHTGLGGEWVYKHECPIHGMRWERPKVSEVELRRDRDLRLAAANLPRYFENYTFQTFPKQGNGALREVQEYARAGRLTQSLFLHGNFGTGKTSLAVSVLRERIEVRGERGLFVVVPTLFEEIKASFGQQGGERSNLMQRVMNVPLLVLDDLGAERATDWTEEGMYNIINHRLIHSKATIVTSNLDVKGLVEHLGARTAERLKAYRIIQMGGANMRDRKAA